MSLPPISRRVRQAVREELVGWTLAAIDDVFQAEEFVPGALSREISGARRARAQEYLENIDWDSQVHRRRFLRVVERVLDLRTQNIVMASNATDERYSEQALRELLQLLERDGYRRDDQGRLVPTSDHMILDLDTHMLRDAAAIHEQLERLLRAWDEDAGQVISSARALIETTCRRILSEREVAVDDLGDHPKLPQLVGRSLEVLDLHPRQIDVDSWGEEVSAAARRVLGGLTTVTDGLAALRNRSGADHGRAHAVQLPTRWGHLAAGAAVTVCRMLLETHAVRGKVEAEGGS